VLFANIDLAVNAVTIVLQVVVLGRMLPRLGLGWDPGAAAGVARRVPRRWGRRRCWRWSSVAQVASPGGRLRAVAKPAREVLFTQVDREAKYKAKNFIDTVAYRGGDAVGAWVFHGLRGLGLGLSALALLAAPIAGLWAVGSVMLGRAARPRLGG
jgi:AAA family ATP:ADP antiporter